jgi:hypothetical protein
MTMKYFEAFSAFMTRTHQSHSLSSNPLIPIPGLLPSTPLTLLLRILTLLQNPLLNQFLGTRPPLESLLQTVRPHMQIQLPLVTLQRRRSRGVWEDVALHEVVAGGALVQAFAEIIGCALAFEFEGTGLESSVLVVSYMGTLPR